MPIAAITYGSETEFLAAQRLLNRLMPGRPIPIESVDRRVADLLRREGVIDVEVPQGGVRVSARSRLIPVCVTCYQRARDEVLAAIEASPQRQERRKRAEMAGRLASACRLIGVYPSAKAFECDECGRWADSTEAATALEGLIPKAFGFSGPRWIALREDGKVWPLRPAMLMRRVGKTYDQALATLEAAERFGLLERRGKGFSVAPAKCSLCYERRSLEQRVLPAGTSARDPIPPQLRFRVLQRDAFRCQYCGRSARDGATLHLDHVVPVAAGGETSEDNLITACETCNMGKSATAILPS